MKASPESDGFKMMVTCFTILTTLISARFALIVALILNNPKSSLGFGLHSTGIMILGRANYSRISPSQITVA